LITTDCTTRETTYSKFRKKISFGRFVSLNVFRNTIQLAACNARCSRSRKFG